MRQLFSIALILFVATSCMNQSKTALEPPPRLDPMANPNWTAEEKAAYEKCLEESIMQAVAWEVIQQQCSDTVNRRPNPGEAR